MIGRVFGGKYKILDEVGSGATARVYCARNTLTNEIVAVKILHPSVARDEQFLQRFQREAAILASLSNPHIVKQYEIGNQDGVYYLVLEYVEGRLLNDIIAEQGHLLLSRALDIAIQVAEGLESAHKVGIVHRDIKPQNIAIVRGRSVKIMDFGMAKGARQVGLTSTSTFVGTPFYVAPEQGTGMPADIRADIYSLGIVLYEMIVGEVPFIDESAVRIVLKHLNEPVPPLRSRRDDVPIQIEEIVNKTLAKDPNRRYQTPTELKLALQRALRNLEDRGASEGRDTTTTGVSLKARLVLEANGQEFAITVPLASIGRSDPSIKVAPTIDLSRVEHGRSVSRQHARIICQNGRYFVEDLESTNKTYLNGEALIPGQLHGLKDQDRLRFGGVRCIVQLGA